MSRAALELERQVKEMKARAAKESGRTAGKAKEAHVDAEGSGSGFFNQDEEPTGKEVLTGDAASVTTGGTNLSRQGQATGGNDAAGADGKAEGKSKEAMAKKSASGGKKAKSGAKKAAAPKAVKAPKPPKAAKTPKGERKPREKKVASGKLKKIEATGTTYLRLEFEEGAIMLTPTGNREQNRDIAVKALRALL